MKERRSTEVRQETNNNSGDEFVANFVRSTRVKGRVGNEPSVARSTSGQQDEHLTDNNNHFAEARNERKLHKISQQKLERMAATVTKRVTLHGHHYIGILRNEFHAFLEETEADMNNLEHYLKKLALLLPSAGVLVNVGGDDPGELHDRYKERAKDQGPEVVAKRSPRTLR